MQCRAAEDATGPQTAHAVRQSMSCATVTGLGDAVYFVVTDGQPIPNALRDWKNRMKAVTCLNLRKLPEVAQV
eukprot:2785042-Karenia_brevis.AAC.1